VKRLGLAVSLGLLAVMLAGCGGGTTTALGPDGGDVGDAASYAQWKAGLCSGGDKLAAANEGMANAFIDVDINDDTEGSPHHFTLGTVAGDPGNPNDDNARLLYGWPGSPGTSDTTIRVNGTSYEYGTDGTYVSGPTLAAGVYESVMTYAGDIQVTQRLSFVPFTPGGDERALLIEYECLNNAVGAPSHTVGVRVMLDLMIAGNDGAPFQVNGVNIYNETDFVGANVPGPWFAYDQAPGPTIVARGGLRDSFSPVPDRFTIARWGSIAGVPWDYTPTGQDITGDSAVGIQWNERPLAPGANFTCATLYGAGDELAIWDFTFHDPTRDTWLRGRFTPPQVQYDWPTGSSGVLDVGSRLTHQGDHVSCRWLGPAGRLQFAGRIGVDLCQGSYSGAPHSSQLCIDPWGVEP
jgi:hypothetical protein